MNGHTIAWGIVFIVILAAAGAWASLWRITSGLTIWPARWTQFQVEQVEVVSTGYLCQVRSKLSGNFLAYFFSRDDVKKIEYQVGQGLRRTLIIKKKALKRRGLL